MATKNSTVEEKVSEIVAKQFKKEIGEISRETRLVEDLYAKSINTIELNALLENSFDIEIPVFEARNNKTVGDFVDLVERLLKE